MPNATGNNVLCTRLSFGTVNAARAYSGNLDIGTITADVPLRRGNVDFLDALPRALERPVGKLAHQVPSLTKRHTLEANGHLRLDCRARRESRCLGYSRTDLFDVDIHSIVVALLSLPVSC